MRITKLTSVYGEHAIGGAERSAAGMVANLKARGHVVDVISLTFAGDARDPVQTSPNGALVHIPLVQFYDPYGLNGKPALPHHAVVRAAWHALDVYNPWMAARVQRQLETLRPDVLFTHAIQGFSVAVWAVARKLGIKVVHMVHDHALICPGTAMTRGAVSCEKPCASCQTYSTLRETIAVMPDAIIAPSQLVLDRHRRFGWFHQVKTQVVVGNALPANWPQAPTGKQLPGPDNPRPMVFGFIGRLDPSKGADTLVAAAAQFSPDQCSVRLAGGGDSNALMTSFSGKPGVVTFCGVVNAAQFLAGIDVLVMVSRAHETFCNVVMEAACLGIPAIVSDRGALPERVFQGESGWVIPAGDHHALARAMAFCIANPVEVARKGQIGLDARLTYSQKTQTDQLEDLLFQVVNDNAHPAN